MSENKEPTAEDLYNFLDALYKYDQIRVADDYTNEEVEQAILEISQENKQSKNSD